MKKEERKHVVQARLTKKELDAFDRFVDNKYSNRSLMIRRLINEACSKRT